MKRWAFGLLGAMVVTAGLVVLAVAAPPDRSQTYTTPFPPPREVLDRLNLQMGWRTYVPTDGRRDGLATVQLHNKDLFVQTRSGLVVLLDAETGVIRWRSRVGVPYRLAHPLTYNSREVYVVHSTYLFALDMRTGMSRWHFRLPEGVSAPPVADENFIFIAAASGRLSAYVLPRPEVLPTLAEGEIPAYDVTPVKKETDEERRRRMVAIKGEQPRSTASVSYLTPSARDASMDEVTGPQPKRLWTEVTSLRLELPIVYTIEHLLLPSPGGIVLAMAKVPQEGSATAAEKYRFNTNSTIRVPAGHYEDMTYVGTDDANLYALQVSNGRVVWRYTAGTAVSRPPAVTAEDIYVVAERNGMTRLDRVSGEPRIAHPGSRPAGGEQRRRGSFPGRQPQVRVRGRRQRPTAHPRPPARCPAQQLRCHQLRFPRQQ